MAVSPQTKPSGLSYKKEFSQFILRYRADGILRYLQGFWIGRFKANSAGSVCWRGCPITGKAETDDFALGR